MDINGVGATAFHVATIRAMEKDEEHPFYSDPYAKLFTSDEFRGKIDQMSSVFPEIALIVRFRTSIYNAIVDQAIANGMPQIVTLGAGFDMRAHIFRADGVVFYEIDQPAVIRRKSDVLARHGISPVASVPCNYLEVDVAEKLSETGFDPGKPSLFVWEGNTMYLPESRIFPFVNRLCADIPAITLAFDYLSNRVLETGDGCEAAFAAMNRVRSLVGAEFVTGFDDLSVFEDKTPLKRLESGTLLEGAERYVAENVPAAYFESLAQETDFLQQYSYCVMECRHAAGATTAA